MSRPGSAAPCCRLACPEIAGHRGRETRCRVERPCRGTRRPASRGRRRTGTPSRSGTAPAAPAGSPVRAWRASRSPPASSRRRATSGWRIVPAGMSSAVSLLRLATANGPDPMGWRPNGRSGSWSDRDAREDVGRGDRLGRRLEEATERGLEREHDGQRALGRDRDLVPRPRARTRVLGILEDADRERDILGCDRLAVVPAGVIAQVEGPHGSRRIHGPALGEVRHERSGRSVPHEPGSRRARRGRGRPGCGHSTG